MATKKVIEIEVKDDLDKTTKNVNKLNKEVDTTKEKFKDTKKASDDVKTSVDNATGGMVSKFQGLTSTLGNVIKSFGLLKTAIIGTGIGALVISILAIKQAFTSSEEGQNRWAKIMQYVGTIVGNVTDILTEMGNKLIWIFTHPVEAIKNFSNLIKQNIVNRFNGLLELIPNLGKAITKLFSGDFKGAAKVAVDATAKVALGIDGITNKLNESAKAMQNFIKEQERELAISEKIANKRAKADRIERDLLVERAKADRDIADLRDKAVQKDIFSVEQRIAFLTKAQRIENAIAKKEIETAKLRRDAKIEENKLSNSNKEALKEEQELRARVIELETKSIQANKALNKTLYTARQEAIADAKMLSDEKVKIKKEERAELDAIDTLPSKKIQQVIDDGTKELELRGKINEMILEQTLSPIELEKKAVEEKYLSLQSQAQKNKEVLAEIEIAKTNDLAKINEKYRKEQAQKDLDLQLNKVQIASSTFSALGALTEAFAGKTEEEQKKAFEVKKAFDIAQAVLDGYKAVLSAYAHGNSIGGPILGGIEAGVAGGFAIAQIRKIEQSTFTPSTPSVGGGGTGGQQQQERIQAPTFNIIGEANQTQQVSEKPVKAYVVSGEVTTQQSLDRNRLRNATL